MDEKLRMAIDYFIGHNRIISLPPESKKHVLTLIEYAQEQTQKEKEVKDDSK